MRHAKNRDEVTSRRRCEVDQANSQGIGTGSRSTRSAYDIVATNARSLARHASEGETPHRTGTNLRVGGMLITKDGLDCRLDSLCLNMLSGLDAASLVVPLKTAATATRTFVDVAINKVLRP